MGVPDADDVPTEPNSPVCSMNGASDAYLGYAPIPELIAALNELLEAKRAGARVATESAGTASDAATGAMLTEVSADEARWCAMLHRWVAELGGAPSADVGACRSKTIGEPRERLAFLNRGQAWVVRKLQALTPRVRNDRLHADLMEMLRAHERNIDRANVLLNDDASVGHTRTG
jgi:hypothetical protein